MHLNIMTGALHLQAKNQVYRIIEVGGNDVIVERLLEMGFAPGEEVRVVSQMMFAGPMITEIQGATVALRLEEAACIQVLL